MDDFLLETVLEKLENLDLQKKSISIMKIKKVIW